MPMITRIAMNGVGVPDARFRGFDVEPDPPGRGARQGRAEAPAERRGQDQRDQAVHRDLRTRHQADRPRAAEVQGSVRRQCRHRRGGDDRGRGSRDLSGACPEARSRARSSAMPAGCARPMRAPTWSACISTSCVHRRSGWTACPSGPIDIRPNRVSGIKVVASGTQCRQPRHGVDGVRAAVRMAGACGADAARSIWRRPSTS